MELKDQEITGNEVPTQGKVEMQRAMNYSVQNLLAQHLEHTKNNLPNDLETAIVDATNFQGGQCETVCTLAGKYLEINHKNLFKNARLVEGKPTKEHPFSRRNWDFHVYLVTESIEGKFYACSPANYGMIEPNPLTTLLESESIEDIVEQIKKLEGGEWDEKKERLLWDHFDTSMLKLRRNTEVVRVAESVFKPKGRRDLMVEEFDREKRKNVVERLKKFFSGNNEKKE